MIVAVIVQINFQDVQARMPAELHNFRQVQARGTCGPYRLCYSGMPYPVDPCVDDDFLTEGLNQVVQPVPAQGPFQGSSLAYSIEKRTWMSPSNLKPSRKGLPCRLWQSQSDALGLTLAEDGKGPRIQIEMLKLGIRSGGGYQEDFDNR